MNTETTRLWSDPSIDSMLVRHVRPAGAPRPAVLVIPGGGYCCVCESTEGTPIANRFDELGYQTFVLKYRVAPSGRFPDALEDGMRAMRLIRGNAAKWGVIPDQIAACGFSAGGHLAASLGTITFAAKAENGDAFDSVDPVPNALLLCYPVLLSDQYGHVGSRRKYFGIPDDQAPTPEQDALFQLPEHVTGATPPAFLWTTPEDTVVPMENSLAFMDAMRRHGRPCDLHVFARGPHGMQLGYGRNDIAKWPELADAFMHDTCGFRDPDRPCPGTVVLTFDDCPRSHLDYVAPLLRKYGFGATFFVTRFDDAWRSEHDESACLLSQQDVRALHDMGFEIGNHTWNHACCMDDMDDAAAAAEFDRLEAWLAEAGVPRPKTFAYPGGPHRVKAERIARERGYIGARAVEDTGMRPWNPAADSPFHIPSVAIKENVDWAFYHAIDNMAGAKWRAAMLDTDPAPEPLPKDTVAVFVFHGVPDRVHPWCNTEPATFEKFMAFLHGRNFRCVSLAEAIEERRNPSG